ncbi:hypothetical protein FOA52_010408 [Chlamydomonas sp. UWO 241]|nr:hypothetical protein FOA52_010408 [Chlamydomonas sp. UWO 241]
MQLVRSAGWTRHDITTLSAAEWEATRVGKQKRSGSPVSYESTLVCGHKPAQRQRDLLGIKADVGDAHIPGPDWKFWYEGFTQACGGVPNQWEVLRLQKMCKADADERTHAYNARLKAQREAQQQAGGRLQGGDASSCSKKHKVASVFDSEATYEEVHLN